MAFGSELLLRARGKHRAGDDDETADHGFLPGARHAGEDHHVVDQRDEDDAEERAGDRATPLAPRTDTRRHTIADHKIGTDQDLDGRLLSR